MSVCDKEQIFLFPGERLVETICHKGLRFEVVERAESVWCGTLGYALNLTEEPDIPGLLEKYQSLVSVEKRGLVSPDWSGCISVGYWPGGTSPRGIMFMQQVDTGEQDGRHDVLKTPSSLYIRLHYDGAEVPRRLFGRDQCEAFELYGAIHEAAEENGYTFHPTEEIEIEYYGSKSCYAYCAVEKK